MRVQFALLILAACAPDHVTRDSGVIDAPPDIPAIAPSPPTWPPPRPTPAQAQACPELSPPPCIVEVVNSEPAQIAYRICCAKTGSRTRVAALAVDSQSGIWGDVTKWAFCDWPYVDEFTDRNADGTVPWAVLSVYDGNGGPIAECASANAPSGARRQRVRVGIQN